MLAFALALSLTAQAERIYIANDDHTDWYWTLDEDGYRAAFLNMIEFYLDEAERTAGNPSNMRGRFNLDGSLWVYEWEHNKSAAEMQRLMDHVAAGDISVQFHSLVLLGGAMPTEAVLRDMYYAGRLERRFGVDVDMAVMMENQTLAGGLASLWAGAGAKYSWRGICDCATRLSSAGSRAREIYRFTGHDGQGVLLKWNSIVGNNQSVGGYAEAFDPDAAVTLLESDAGYLSRWPYPVKAAFGHGWDAAETETDAFIDVATARSDAAHEVIVSNETDFFRDFEESVDVDNEVPQFLGAMGNEWELNTASLAAVTGDMRASIERLRVAEGLSAIVAHADPSFLDGRFDGTDEERELAELHMGMYFDHDWTADSPTLHDARAQFQRDTAAQVHAYVDGLERDAISALSAAVPAAGAADAANGHTRVVIANPLATFSESLVELRGIDFPFRAVDVGDGPFPIPAQLVTDADGSKHAFVLLAAPSLGTTYIDVTPLEGAPDLPLCTVVNEPNGAITIDDTHMTVTIEKDGSISSLVNAHDLRQLAGNGLFTFDVDGARDPAEAAAVVLETNGPALCRVRVDVPSSPPRTVRYTLGGEDRMNVEEIITGNFSGTAGYAVDLADLGAGAVVHHEEVGMLATARRLSHGGDYADEDARTDFLTLNHFVDAGDVLHGFAVASTESGFMKVGASDVDTLDENPARILLVAGMHVDDNLGFADQGGDVRFVNHYAFIPRDFEYDPSFAMSQALQFQNPPVGVVATGGPDAPLSSPREVLLEVSGAAPFWVKPADDGAAFGLIVRAWNTFPTDNEVHLKGPIAAATRTTHVETDRDFLAQPALDPDGDVVQTLHTDELATFRVFLEGAATGEGEGEGEGEGDVGEGEGDVGEGEGDVAEGEGEGDGDGVGGGCHCGSMRDGVDGVVDGAALSIALAAVGARARRRRHA